MPHITPRRALGECSHRIGIRILIEVVSSDEDNVRKLAGFERTDLRLKVRRPRTSSYDLTQQLLIAQRCVPMKGRARYHLRTNLRPVHHGKEIECRTGRCTI